MCIRDRWEVVLLARSYKGDTTAVARHLAWPVSKVQAALHYAEAFSKEIQEALAENNAMGFKALKRMLPQTLEFPRPKAAKR